MTLQSDPLCGLPPAGGGCELDCDIDKNFPLVYSDPTCLSDCLVGEVEEEDEIRNVDEGEEEECFRHLYQDFEDAGRIGMIFFILYFY